MSPRLVLLRSYFMALAIWGAYHMTAQSEASLAVEIRDAATGEITPAMVCITSLQDPRSEYEKLSREAGK